MMRALTFEASKRTSGPRPTVNIARRDALNCAGVRNKWATNSTKVTSDERKIVEGGCRIAQIVGLKGGENW